MTFRTLAIVTALLGFALALGYLFVGNLVVGRWQIEPTESVLLLGRRMAALYLGLSVMMFLARSAPAGITRTALCAGAAVALSLLALLGIYELAGGRVGAGILASIAVEGLLALGYIALLITGAKAKDATPRLMR